ncbi:MAG: cation:proton antiporter, partial [Gemmatimonadales bacterium]
MPVAPPVLVNVLILLIVVATGVALITRRVGVPYTVGLVVAGLGLGAFRLIAAPHLTRELVFSVFLPGLVFEAALRLRFADVRRDLQAIVALAVPGVVLALLLTAVLLVMASRLLPGADGFGWRQGLVFGALIAATDPIAVVALFRSLAAPARLTVLIEAESLLNDGTAIVFFGLIMTATAGGDALFSHLLLEFFRV